MRKGPEAIVLLISAIPVALIESGVPPLGANVNFADSALKQSPKKFAPIRNHVA